MHWERFVVVRLHPALNGDGEGEPASPTCGPIREIAEAIGRHLNLPARSLPAEEFEGMLVRLLSTDMPASSTITQDLLGWKPTHPALLEDIEQGHYFI